jgi:ribonuclease HI
MSTKGDISDVNKDLAIVYCDGASNIIKGRSGIGMVWYNPESVKNINDGETLKSDDRFIFGFEKEIYGDKTPTNNEAEYQSIIDALKISIRAGIKKIIVFMDSKLVVKQVNNEWKINFYHLQKLKNEIDVLKKDIKIEVKHVHREFNSWADKFSKMHLKRQKQNQITFSDEVQKSELKCNNVKQEQNEIKLRTKITDFAEFIVPPKPKPIEYIKSDIVTIKSKIAKYQFKISELQIELEELNKYN